MTVINPWPPASNSAAMDQPPGSVNPGSPCPACAATATGDVFMNQVCPTDEHEPGEQGIACTTIDVHHEPGCPKPLNVDD